jgi:hypothetical protein
MVENSKLSASEIYLSALPLFSNSSVELLDSQQLVSQLRGLERKTRSGGKDLVTHYPGGHDDLANVVCGVAVQIYRHSSIIRDEPPSLGYVEEVVDEKERIKSEFDDELRGKLKKSKDEEELDAIDEAEWDISQWSATQIAEKLAETKEKKKPKSHVKFFKDWG